MNGAPDVLIVGAGPAGLTAAAALAPRVSGDVLVLEREAVAGGIPRHSDHPGYGIRDRRAFLSGPRYARRLTTEALRAGARVQTRTMVTGWAGDRTLVATSPAGRAEIRPRALVLATGARERPRAARLIPGDRPDGVMTTGQLQNVVHLHGRVPGGRAVIVGAELVSWSAVMTLRHAGCRPLMLVTAHSRPETHAAAALAGRAMLRVPVRTATRVARIIGRPRVSAVELEHLGSGTREIVPCDTVVFTGDWIPDHELARSGGLDIDPGTRGPLIDSEQATSRAGIYAIGNLTHPVDTADVAALDGRAVAGAVLAHLAGIGSGRASATRLYPGDGLAWLSPGLLLPDVAPPRGRFLAWPRHAVGAPVLTLRQDGALVTRRRVLSPASPGRVLRIPASLFAGVRPGGPPVTVELTAR